MRHVIVDASVAVKWVFPDRADESDVSAALDLLERIRGGEILAVQPPHWLAEMAAVCCRLGPSIAEEALSFLHDMDLPVIDTIEAYRTACELSRDLNHHVFDTLYHAVALTLSDTRLVTADARYYRKARSHGAIAMLPDHRLA